MITVISLQRLKTFLEQIKGIFVLKSNLSTNDFATANSGEITVKNAASAKSVAWNNVSDKPSLYNKTEVDKAISDAAPKGISDVEIGELGCVARPTSPDFDNKTATIVSLYTDPDKQNTLVGYVDVFGVNKTVSGGAATIFSSGTVVSTLADANKFLRGDGTWQAISAGTDVQEATDDEIIAIFES